jgi:hypothetical protein
MRWLGVVVGDTFRQRSLDSYRWAQMLASRLLAKTMQPTGVSEFRCSWSFAARWWVCWFPLRVALAERRVHFSQTPLNTLILGAPSRLCNPLE